MSPERPWNAEYPQSNSGTMRLEMGSAAKRAHAAGNKTLKPETVPMRLTSHQQQAIREEVTRVFGQGAAVRLFGSRVDDATTGGDVDLLIETPTKIPLATEIKLQAQLENQLGEPVDIITTSPVQQGRPIVEIARLTGVAL